MTVVPDWSLLDGPLPVVIAVAGVAGAAFLVWRRSRRWWTRWVPAVAAGSAAVTVLVALYVERVWRPFPDPLPLRVLGAIGATAAALGLGACGFRARRWRGRVTTVVAVVLVVVAAGQTVNANYREFPTLRVALGLPAADEIAFADVPATQPMLVAAPGTPLEATWQPPPDMPARGSVAEVDIPATTSGFTPRHGWVYLPPAYLTRPRARLPVLVLLSGQPGSPRDWLGGGELAARMDAFAAGHQGLAPVVVVPDHLGSALANPLCLDSRLGRVASYLSVDVPAWVRGALQIDPDPRAWAIGGFSSGGTCSLQMAVTAPAVYPTFVDLAGEAEPTLGDRASTVQATFAGDAAAFAAVDPLEVLASRRFPDTAGYLVGGEQDALYLPQARQVLAACLAAGMDAQLQVLPGPHNWQVWGPGLDGALPWLARRTGLVP